MSPDTDLRGLMFCSVLSAGLERVQLEALADRLRNYNVRHGISGIVLLRKRLAVHWLEGPAHPIERAWQRIQNHASHSCIAELFDGPLQGDFRLANEALTVALASREDMLALVRAAYQHQMRQQVTPAVPTLVQVAAPLLVLLNGQHSGAV
jgi:Sensors of blue-light using FAD